MAITQGDTNGIGFRSDFESSGRPQILELFIPVVYGTPKALAIHRKTLNLPELNINTIKKAEQAQKNKINFRIGIRTGCES